MDYKVKKQDGKAELNFNADKELLEDVLVWEAYSDDKDFRPKKFEPSRLGISAKANFFVEVAYPKKGYKAFMVMLKYKHPSISGATYNITTRMYTADSDELFDETFVP